MIIEIQKNLGNNIKKGSIFQWKDPERLSDPHNYTLDGQLIDQQTFDIVLDYLNDFYGRVIMDREVNVSDTVKVGIQSKNILLVIEDLRRNNQVQKSKYKTFFKLKTYHGII